MCKCSLIDTTTLTLPDADNEQKVVASIDDLLEFAYNYLDRSKWIRPRVRFSLRKRSIPEEGTPPNTPPTENTPPAEDTLPNTPSTENTLRAEDTLLNTPSTENTLPAEDTLLNTPPTETTPPVKETPPSKSSIENTQSPEDTTRISPILKCNFDDYSTEVLIQSNIKQWFTNPSSFCKQGTGGTNLETEDAQCRLVQLILDLGVSDAHSYALRRICSVALHRIRARYPQCRGPKDIARSMYGNDYSPGCIATISGIMSAGPKYDAIGKRKGYGILLLLGTDIPFYMWEERLPLSGPLFDQVMGHLDKQGLTESGKLYDTLVLNIIEQLETYIPKPSVKFIGGPKKRACPSKNSASKPKSKRTRLSKSSSFKPVTEHQHDITRTYTQRDNSEKEHALQYQGTNDPHREAQLGRMAMRNLVSDYSTPDSSSNGAVNSDLSILSIYDLQFTENRNMNQANATCDMIRTVQDTPPNLTWIGHDRLQQSPTEILVRATNAQCSTSNSDSLTQNGISTLGRNQANLDNAHIQTSLNNEASETSARISYTAAGPGQSSNADGSALAPYDPRAEQGSHGDFNWENWEPIIQQTWNNSIVIPPQHDSNPIIHQSRNNPTVIPLIPPLYDLSLDSSLSLRQYNQDPVIQQTWNNSAAVRSQYNLDSVIQQTWSNSAVVPSQYNPEPVIQQTWDNPAAVSQQYNYDSIIQQTWNNSAAVVPPQHNLDPANVTQYPAWTNSCDMPPQSWESHVNAREIST